MKYRVLGKTGFRISEITHGTWKIGDGWGLTQDVEISMQIIKKAIAHGVNAIDTALGYGSGRSEEIVGKAVKNIREKVYIFTKVPPKNSHWPALPGVPVSEIFPAKYIIKCTERSLKNLQTDYIDLQQLHVWNDEYLQNMEWYEALLKLKKDGKIRAFGVSSNDWDPNGTLNLVKSGLIDTVQVNYSIFEQRPEDYLFPSAMKNNIGILARVPFHEGLLTGTIRPGHKFADGDWRAEWLTKERIEEADPILCQLEMLLNKNCPSLATLAIKYCLSQSAVSTVVVGMGTPGHVESNCKASDGILLTSDEILHVKKHAKLFDWRFPWA
ncbi:MAG: aldo/keto reductase [Candidatus Humimicrobiaceae bacterium]